MGRHKMDCGPDQKGHKTNPTSKKKKPKNTYKIKFFGSIEVELRALYLLDTNSATQVRSPIPFFLVIFQVGCLLFT
jgi:hypothetical protein